MTQTLVSAFSHEQNCGSTSTPQKKASREQLETELRRPRSSLAAAPHHPSAGRPRGEKWGSTGQTGSEQGEMVDLYGFIWIYGI